MYACFKWSFTFKFSDQNFVNIRVTYSAHLIISDMIKVMIFGEENKLCIVFHPLVTSTWAELFS
jgi:hypothetical protein